MKHSSFLSIVALLACAHNIEARTLVDYERAAGLPHSNSEAEALRSRLVPSNVTIDQASFETPLKNDVNVEGHRYFSSIVFKQLVGPAIEKIQPLLENGAPIDFDPDKPRDERARNLQSVRNKTCIDALSEASRASNPQPIFDAILSKLARPEMDAMAGAFESPAAAPKAPGPLEKALSASLTNYLDRAVGQEKSRKAMAALGELIDVDTVNGRPFRLTFRTPDSRAMTMSLTMLLTMASKQDETFISTLDCLDQTLAQELDLLGQGKHRVKYGDNRVLFIRLFGRKPEDGIANVTAKATLLKQYVSFKLEDAIHAHDVMARVGASARRALAGAFLSFQRDEIPNPENATALAEQFQKRIQAASPKEAPALEADYLYYNEVAKLVRKTERQLDLDALNKQQIEMDMKLYRR